MTELVFILDRSGSMGGLEKDTIGGFNSLIAKQRAEKGDALVSLVLFDHVSEVVFDRVPLAEVPELTEKEYYVRGSTALLDAVGGAVSHIGNVHRYIGKYAKNGAAVPEKTLFVITTDGMENSSREYTYKKVRGMIERQKSEYGWEFLFLGANIDAEAEAERYGIERSRAVRFHSDSKGTALNYSVVAAAVSSVVSEERGLSDDWADAIRKDYASRKADD